MFTVRYGLIAYINKIMFCLKKLSCGSDLWFVFQGDKFSVL
jgi:hypothetical protein